MRRNSRNKSRHDKAGSAAKKHGAVLAHALGGSLLACILCAAGAAHAALTLDPDASIEIESDSAVIDEPSGSAVYRGRVMLKQGLVKLQSGELTLYIQNGKAVKAIAVGTPAQLDQAPTAIDEAIHAEANRITFLIEGNRMLLDDMASLRQGERLFQGAHIDYDIAGRRVKASGGGSSRVLLVLPPTTSNETPNPPPTDAPAAPRIKNVLPPAHNNATP